MLRTTWALVLRYPLAIALSAGGMAALDSAIDLAAPEGAASFATSILSIGVVYVVFRLLLKKEGLIEREGSFGSYFAVGFLSGLGVIIGLVLLIVPGLYLMARWSLASALVLARSMKATSALRASAEATRPCVWKLVLLYALCLFLYITICLIIGGATGYMAVDLTQVDAVDTWVPGVIVLNLVLNLGVVAGAYLSVAVYQHLLGDRVEDVFA